METELNNLIAKIKKEGVERAEKDAGAIIEKAEAEAKKILAAAGKRREAMEQESQAAAKDFMLSAEKALNRSARDVLLALRERVTELFDRVVKEKVSGAVTEDVMKEIILKAAENYDKKGSIDIEVLVSGKDRDRLEKALFGELGKEAKKHFTLKGAANIEKGFRIGEEGRDSYIDFTEEAITEAFKGYLNPRLAEVLDIGLNGEKENKGK